MSILGPRLKRKHGCTKQFCISIIKLRTLHSTPATIMKHILAEVLAHTLTRSPVNVFYKSIKYGTWLSLKSTTEVAKEVFSRSSLNSAVMKILPGSLLM